MIMETCSNSFNFHGPFYALPVILVTHDLMICQTPFDISVPYVFNSVRLDLYEAGIPPNPILCAQKRRRIFVHPTTIVGDLMLGHFPEPIGQRPAVQGDGLL